jgi:hypothetical protein|tara:strand:- start:3335 stop:3499 length:165 start_codon:yes stop_codon:yes gene_type:complete
MNIDPQSKISLLAISTIIFGLIVWRISNSVFSSHNRTQRSKFDESEYRKRWKRK